MHRFWFFKALLLFTAPLALAARSPLEEIRSADLIFINGKIVSETATIGLWPSAISIRGNVISTIGPTREILKEKAAHTTVIDLKGAMVLPGIHDSSARLIASRKEASLEDQKNEIQSLIRSALLNGITSISDYQSLESLEALDELNQSHSLGFRFEIWGNLQKQDEYFEQKEKYKSLLSGGEVQLSGLYANLDEHSDLALDQLTALIASANRNAIPVCIVASEPASLNKALSAFASVKRTLFNSRVQNRIAGIKKTNADVIEKLRELGIVTVVEPNQLQLPLKNFLKSKVRIVFGSHGPENSQSWMQLLPTTLKQISPKAALDAWTINSASAKREEHLTGSIREGKVADLFVIDKDIFRSPPETLAKLRVLVTVIGGKIAFQASPNGKSSSK